MTAYERIERLREAFCVRASAKKTEEQAKHLNEVAEMFEPLNSRLRHLEESGQELALTQETQVADFSGLLEVLRKFKKALEQDSYASPNQFLRQAEAVRKKWGSTLVATWRELQVQHGGVQLEEAALNALRPRFGEAVSALEGVASSRRGIPENELPSAEQIKDYKRLAERSEKAIKEIGFSDGKVQADFERLVKAEGVPLNEFTSGDSALSTWLDEHGLLQVCKVRLR